MELNRTLKKLILFMFTGIILFSYSCNNNEEEYEQEIAQLNQQIKDYKEEQELVKFLEDDYENQIKKYKASADSISYYQNQIAEIQKQLRSKSKKKGNENEVIQSLIDNINRLLGENKDLADNLKSQLDTNNYANNSQKDIVDLLIKSIEDKDREIQQLKVQVDDLLVQVGQEKTKVRERDSKIIVITDELTDLQEESSNLEIKSISYSFYNKKGKKIDPKLYINKIKKIKVNFTLKENKLATKGNQKIYLCITNEDVFDFALLRTEDRFTPINNIAYTEFKNINYEGIESSYIIEWDKGNFKLKKGSYSIEIYSEDEILIGGTTFTI